MCERERGGGGEEGRRERGRGREREGGPNWSGLAETRRRIAGKLRDLLNRDKGNGW